MGQTALILVDIQNDFLPGGALPVPEGDAVVAMANQLQDRFGLVVATQDWHPANHRSFAVNHPGKKVYDEILLNGLKQTLWPVHCVQNSFGAEIAPGVNQQRIARIFQKGVDLEIDSYSGFFDNAHRRSTGLGDWLKENAVSEVAICGLATDYCVKFTVLDALQLGFRVNVLERACRGVNLKPSDSMQAIREMRSAGAAHVVSDDP